MNSILGWNTNLFRSKLISFSDHNLRLNNINSSNHLRNGMLNLDTWVHLNKIWVVLIVYKEFQCTRITVTNMFYKSDRTLENSLTNLFRYSKCRCIFNNFLVTSLNRTVTVIKMNNISIIIRKDLNLNMLWTS